MYYRIIALILFLTYGGMSYGQSTLIVNIKDCRAKDRYEYLAEFKLYRNGTLIKTVTPKHERIQVFKFLAYGSYTVVYKSFFDKTESINIELIEKKKYRIDLCLDYLDYENETYIPFIDRLVSGEHYSIKIISSGCFHNSEENVLIERKDDGYYLKYADKKMLLDPELIEEIRHFELELNYIKGGGCTTVDEYLLKYKDHVVFVSDDSCRWNGWYYLKKSLE